MVLKIGRWLTWALVWCGGCGTSALDVEWHTLEDRIDASPVAVGETSDPVAQPGPLTAAWLTEQVLARNPRLDVMRFALRAMLATIPQQTAVPDPTLEIGLAPLSLNNGRGQRLALRQIIPWTATLEARGRSALESARAMERDLDATRRVLVASAHMQLWELGATAHRKLLLGEHHQLVRTLREGAIGRFASGRARPQDALRAESELIMADLMLYEIERMNRQATARINALMHQPPDHPLGETPWPVTLPPSPPPLNTLIALARAQRPEVAAADHRARQMEYDVTAAEAMGRPMLGWGFEVSTMSPDWMMWPMIMFMVELPFASDKRRAMVDEAMASARAARSEQEVVDAELSQEVALRHAELVEALATSHAYDGRVLPTLEQRLSLTMASYGAGQEDFDAVLMAAMAMNNARLERVDVQLRAFIAATALELAVGDIAGTKP